MSHRKHMKRTEKIFVVVGLLLILLVSGGFYVNNQLDHLVQRLNQPGLLANVADSGSKNVGGEQAASGSADSSNPNGQSSSPKGQSGSTSGSSSAAGQQNVDKQPSNGDIAGGVQQKVNKPIEKGDLIKAGLIILRKLNPEEISYLYSVGNKDSYTRDELLKVRTILRSKLSEEDIQTLKSLGAKYGKELRVLDANVKI